MMMLKIFFILFTAFVVAQKDEHYTGFNLSMINSEDSSKDLWTIQSLCPVREGLVQGTKAGEQVIYKYTEITWCTSNGQPKMNPDDLSVEVRQQLEKAWPPFDSAKYSQFEGLWQHQFRKHGRCCLDTIPTPVQYMTTTLQLWKQLKFHELVGREGQIQPNTFYPITEIEQAIFDRYKVRVLLTCGTNLPSEDPQPSDELSNKLTKVWFCFDRTATLESCKNVKTMCADEVYYDRVGQVEPQRVNQIEYPIGETLVI